LNLSSLPLIAPYVVFNLLLPPFGIGLWRAKVNRAAMPETAINKDTYSRATEYDIRLAPDTRNHI
jgi:hypothetical protein